jgi:hypothetical protein
MNARSKAVCILLGICCLTGATAQTERAVAKGKNAVNIYYGVSITGAFYKAVVEQYAEGAYDYKALGPVGIVYEHMLTDAIGLGIEFGYRTMSWTWYYTDTDPNTLLVGQYSASLSNTNIRAMARANFHFAKSKNFDAYGLLSVGYRSNSWTVSASGPGYAESVSSPTFIPFGFKPGLGIRYFFNSPLGIHLEMAAGTPLLCGGVSARF